MPCDRGCRHGKCLNLCSEPCSLEPCNKSCWRLLPCGHKCIGLCGDPCPDKCGVCHSTDPAFEVFFGPEDKQGTRFVHLVDCGHLVHADSITTWVTKAAEMNSICLPHCPECKTPIRKTLRFNSQIKDHLKKVEKVKEKLRVEKDAKCKDLGDEARRQFINNVLNWDQKKKVGELIKKVGAADSALGIQQLLKCQQLLDSLHTVFVLTQQRSKFLNPGAMIHVAMQSLRSWRVSG